MGYERVIVAGGGVAGLGTALALARAGREVLLLERDPLRDASSADEAFDWERPGAPQTHQTHGFLARIVVLMRERFPDLLDALQRAGCSTVSGTSALGEPRPGDEDLAILLVRRTTFEWVLRRAVEAEPGVEVRSDAGVAGLLAATGPAGRCADRRWRRARRRRPRSGADAVVAATGRRGDVPAWLAPLGVAVPETIRQSGLMYLTRWYRVADSFATPPGPKLGGDLGFLKYLIVPGDGGMLSATLAVRSDDRELRRALSRPRPLRPRLPLPAGTGPVVRRARPRAGRRRAADGRAHEPAPVLHRRRRPTGGAQLPRRRRRAHLHQSPLRARLLAGPAPGGAAWPTRSPPTTTRGRSRPAYEAACRDEVTPWFHHAVEIDRVRRRSGQERRTRPPTGDRFGAVLAAGQTDPVIGRAHGPALEPAHEAGRTERTTPSSWPGPPRSWPTPTPIRPP